MLTATDACDFLRHCERAGHRHVEQCNVGGQLVGLLDRLGRRECGTDERELRRLPQHPLQPLAIQTDMGRDENANAMTYDTLPTRQ